MKLFKSNFTLGLISAAVVTLTACGGGGGGSTGPDGTVSRVTGVAATGLAIDNGRVTLKCVTGTTSATATGTDGSFSIDVSSVTLPCVARVTYTDSANAQKKLHSLVSTTGNVNITPVTDLLVAKLSNGPAAAAFDSFDAVKVKSYTKDQVSAATATVKTYLHDLGVDTSKLPDDVIGNTFKAATSSTKGDDFDKVLDDLKGKLESNQMNQEGAEHDVTFGPLAPASAPTTAASAPTAAASSPTAAASSPTATASAVTGKELYASNSVMSCAGCHGTTPSINKVLNGANNPTRILSAISGNNGMNMYSGKFTTQNLADIAAYLATPSI